MAKTILITGSMGSGKTTLTSMPYRTRSTHLGKSAVIDADVVSKMIDPTMELPDEERHLDLSGYQCWLLAQSFLAAGFETVVIASNGFHTPEEGLNDMIAFLLTVSDVYHVTLDPSIEEVRRRLEARGTPLSDESLEQHVAWMRARQRDWTCRIDNSSLTPEATIAEIAERTSRGEGRVTGPLPVSTSTSD